ncbi:MAG TPA: N-6 DNA methylase, partial [Candidatus Lokiarchaeia archaeon]|nr:N-6 DNA methylase [Candidatus Lokiarchaeia archaeon]
MADSSKVRSVGNAGVIPTADSTPNIEPSNKLSGESIKDRFGIKSPVFAEIFGELEANLHANPDNCQELLGEWGGAFTLISRKTHQDQSTQETLFLQQTYLALFVQCVLASRFVPNSCDGKSNPFPELKNLILERNLDLANPPFFKWAEEIPEARTVLFQELRGATFQAGDLFSALYQDVTTPANRHNLGEFYTPPELARQMIQETYQFGTVTLDPACGSGTFLVELQAHILASDHALDEKFAALANVYGFDVSPLAVLVSKANILLGIADLVWHNIPLNVYLRDFLFPNIESLDQNAQEIPHLRDPPEVDLLIGNPPWLVLNGIASITYKQQVKDLARDLGIMMGGKHATHTELVALFFYQGAKCYVKEGGRIFFVATAGLLSGDQHSKFRQFVGFRNPFAWIFDQDVFRIHNICLGVEKGLQHLPDRVKVAVYPFKVSAENGGAVFEKGPVVTYIPYNLQEIHSDNDIVKRLIPQDEVLRILPPGKSEYYDQFFQGASLVPRQFLF